MLWWYLALSGISSQHSSLLPNWTRGIFCPEKPGCVSALSNTKKEPKTVWLCFMSAHLMVGCWCLSKLWTKGSVKSSFDYMDTSVAIYSAAGECSQVTTVQEFILSGFSIWEHRQWRVIENAKWEGHTQQRQRDWTGDWTAVCLICLCCRAELCCSLQDNAVTPAIPFLLHAWKWFASVHFRGRPPVCLSRLVPSAGQCGCSQTLWRVRDWSKSRTSKTQLGTNIQITLKEWDLNHSLERYKHKAESQLVDSFFNFDMNTACCLLAEIIKQLYVTFLNGGRIVLLLPFLHSIHQFPAQHLFFILHY